MNTDKREFAIEFKRESFVTVYVAARSEDEAHALAWIEIERGYAMGSDANWSINSSDEVTA